MGLFPIEIPGFLVSLQSSEALVYGGRWTLAWPAGAKQWLPLGDRFTRSGPSQTLLPCFVHLASFSNIAFGFVGSELKYLPINQRKTMRSPPATYKSEIHCAWSRRLFFHLRFSLNPWSRVTAFSSGFRDLMFGKPHRFIFWSGTWNS